MPEKIIQKDVFKSYKEDMVTYSIGVNRRRSIPEVKDSFKPVQRRILYSMYELGAVSHSTQRKSTKIVGDTMGNFHPHGSCLRGDTNILGLDGNIYRIGDLYNLGVQSIEVLAVDPTGKVVPTIAHSFRIGQYTDNIYHIILSNGEEIKCTSNHPIMLSTLEFKKAEELSIGSRLYTKVLSDLNGTRPYIDGQPLQNLVHDYYFGVAPKGYERHHKDHNYYNNTSTNFETLLSRDHILKHYEEDNTSAIAGLQGGLHSMFDPDGLYYEQTKQKNSVLIRGINKDNIMRKFKSVIRKMQESGMEITPENYESFRGSYYNLPYIDRLIAKGKYGNSFEDLVNYKLESISDYYKKALEEKPFGLRFGNFNNNRSYNINNGELVDPFHTFTNYAKVGVFGVFDRLLDQFGYINYENYLDITQKKDLPEFKFMTYLSMYKAERIYIENIWIENVNREPMYDFTVDGIENMLIPASNSVELKHISQIYFMPMICVHNSSIYGAMSPMANYWECKLPLIAPDGNWGNFMGAGPAADRYTEAALSKFGQEVLFAEMAESKNVVDWSKSYDEKNMEPDYLPTKVPLLLINGSYGIGVGMMTEIPKHNPHEVIDVTRKILRAEIDAATESKRTGKPVDVKNVPVVLIPDHCLPCNIIDTNWKEICRKGSGNYKVRGQVDIEEYEKFPAVIVRSLPDRVNTSMITDKINDMIMNKELPMVKDMIDISGAGEMKIVIQLKKGSDPYFVREVLYKRTDCEKSFTVNFEVVDGLNPVRMNYKQYLEMFLANRAITKFRLYCNKMQKVMTRWHKLDAYIKAIESGQLDDIINMIRKQKTIDDSELVEKLIKMLKITDLQAKFIIDANIKQLSAGYLKKYKEEAKDLWAKKTMYENMISNKELILEEIDQELAYFDQKYGTKRVCKVIKASDDSNIPQGSFKLIITENNFVRKIIDSENPTAVRGDNPKFICEVDNTESVLLFDNKGKVFKLPVHKIPVSERSNPGIDIRLSIKGLTADIIALMYEPDIKLVADMKEKHFITIVTENNYIKKLDIEDFLAVPPSGIIYTKLTDNDSVKNIEIIPDKFDVIIYSGHKALRIPMLEVPHYKRASQGVFAMNTHDKIGGLSVVYPDADYVLVITKSGKINKFNITGLERSTRYKAGSSVIKMSSTDEIFAIYGVNDSNVLKITTENEVLEVPVSGIAVTSSVTAGVKKINTRSNSIIRTDILIK